MDQSRVRNGIVMTSREEQGKVEHDVKDRNKQNRAEQGGVGKK